jgi:MFS family permease
MKIGQGAKPGLDLRLDPYAALRFRDFRLLLVGRFITSFGTQMLSFAIAWELWLRTRSAFALGLVGLVQVIPVFILSLYAGHVADQYNRRKIAKVTQGFLALCSLCLGMLSFMEGPLVLVYVCLLGVGIARAFNDPATATILPETVPLETFANAATWTSSTWQFAAILGPALAGFIAALLDSVTAIYIFTAVSALTFLVLISMIRSPPRPLASKATTRESLTEGLRFIRRTKIILAAITLDMFAVLFGGAVALLPVYATDILNVGASGLGIMRAAPSVGALIMAFLLAHMPPFQHTGRTLLLAVAGFGVSTIVFGLSTSFPLSVGMLALLGGLDNISVVIRSSLILLWTPDEMRGRASAVNSVFIGASNEFGEFESGSVAALLGPVFAVVSGGIGTVLVVLAIAKAWPEMRSLKRLEPESATARR